MGMFRKTIHMAIVVVYTLVSSQLRVDGAGCSSAARCRCRAAWWSCRPKRASAPPLPNWQIGIAACIGAIRWININIQNYSLFADL